MLFDFLEFLHSKHVFFLKDPVRNTDLTHIVQQAGNLDSLPVYSFEPHLIGDGQGKHGHSFGVSTGVRVSLIDGGCQGANRSEEEVSVILGRSFKIQEVGPQLLAHVVY